MFWKEQSVQTIVINNHKDESQFYYEFVFMGIFKAFWFRVVWSLIQVLQLLYI